MFMNIPFILLQCATFFYLISTAGYFCYLFHQKNRIQQTPRRCGGRGRGSSVCHCSAKRSTWRTAHLHPWPEPVHGWPLPCRHVHIHPVPVPFKNSWCVCRSHDQCPDDCIHFLPEAAKTRTRYTRAFSFSGILYSFSVERPCLPWPAVQASFI